jgi:hypothetical protein
MRAFRVLLGAGLMLTQMLTSVHCIVNQDILNYLIDMRAEITTQNSDIIAALFSAEGEQETFRGEVRSALLHASGNLTSLGVDTDTLIAQLAEVNVNATEIAEVLAALNLAINESNAPLTPYDQECFCITPFVDQVSVEDELGYERTLSVLNATKKGVCWQKTTEGLRPDRLWKQDGRTRWVSAVDAVAYRVSTTIPMTCNNGTRESSVFWGYRNCSDPSVCGVVNVALRPRYVGNHQYRSFEQNTPSNFMINRVKESILIDNAYSEVYVCSAHSWRSYPVAKTIQATTVLALNGFMPSPQQAPIFDGSDPATNYCPGFFGVNIECSFPVGSQVAPCYGGWSNVDGLVAVTTPSPVSYPTGDLYPPTGSIFAFASSAECLTYLPDETEETAATCNFGYFQDMTTMEYFMMIQVGESPPASTGFPPHQWYPAFFVAPEDTPEIVPDQYSLCTAVGGSPSVITVVQRASDLTSTIPIAVSAGTRDGTTGWLIRMATASAFVANGEGDLKRLSFTCI